MASEENENDEFGVSNTASLRDRLNREKTPEQREAELLEHPSYIELQKKLTEAEKKADENFERMLRIQAETDNALRRAERDVGNAHKYALEKFLSELLPIIDSLERAVTSHENEEGGEGSLLGGVSLTLKMLYAALEKFNIQQVNPENEFFNPEWHQAVSTQSDPNAESGKILTVLQKGYLLNGRLIRPALVIVAK